MRRNWRRVLVVQASITVALGSLLVCCVAAMASKIPPPPAISLPVWSLAVSTQALQQQRQLQQQQQTKALVDDGGSILQDTNHIQFPETSMNIVTFCSAVSVAPPKLWIVSLYYDTLTKDSFLAAAGDTDENVAVLQLLRPAHKHLIPVLGKQSGYDAAYSKRQECAQRGFPWVTTSAFEADDDNTPLHNEMIELLPDCAAYIYLKLVNTMPAGDHVVALCEVVRTGRWDGSRNMPVPDSTAPLPRDSDTVLYTGLLRKEGII
jgi:hypothetical protein